ncbi:MAG: winged helix-turn-helix domain-containing protein [Nanoarchaeota archaeon]
MKDITSNEMKFILTILKSPQEELNARNISKLINISPMGALKIAKRLQKENIISSRKIGKGIYYYLNLNEEYVIKYLKFLLHREAEQATPYIRVWLYELKKIKSSEGVILFGSVLHKEKEARDIDALIIVNKKGFDSVKKEVEEINLINIKKVHPLYQTKADLKKHINEKNKVILNAVKGIYVSEEDNLIEALKR